MPNELRLLFECTDTGYAVRHAYDKAAAGPVPLTPFLSEEDYENLRWYLEEYMDLPDGGAVVRARRIEQDLEAWGRRLGDAAFPAGGPATLLGKLLAGPEPRHLTIATKDADVLRLPWELLADAVGPLSRRGVTVRRQLETAQDTTVRPLDLPLRLLLIVSRPDDLGFIDPRHTTLALLDALKPLGDDVAVDFCRPPTMARLEEMLADAKKQNRPYHLVHFDGHGTFLPHSQVGALCFERERPGGGAATDLVEAGRLGNILAGANVPVVVLEACRSGQIGKSAVFRAVAPRLLDAGVGSVLSMSHAVHVEAARILLERFYRELATNATVGQAVEAGRAALIAEPNRWIEIERGPLGRQVALQDWFLPHLYQRGRDDPRLLPAGQEAFDVFLSHRHVDGDRVEALALRLRERHGLKVWLDKWYLKKGNIRSACVEGVNKSRNVAVVCSRSTLESEWVQAEIDWAFNKDKRGLNILPVMLEKVELPLELDGLLHHDFTDPDRDEANTARLAEAIREEVPPREVRRPPATGQKPGAFPRPPLYQFHGRAAELYHLERAFRGHRAILLHAQGGSVTTGNTTPSQGPGGRLYIIIPWPIWKSMRSR